MASVGDVLLDILVVLIAAKVAAEIAERVGFPPVVAEILAGVVIGPSVFDVVGHDDTLLVLGEIGVILLLLQVGMEMDLGELAAVGRASMSVAVVGVVVPMSAGFAVAQLFGHDTNTSLFIGAALAATSVGITARVFSDLRALASVEARTVLGAAVVDDVLGLVILTVVVRIVSDGSVSAGSVLWIVAVAVGFLVVTTFVGSRAAPPLFRFINRNSRSAGTMVAIALAFTLAFARARRGGEARPDRRRLRRGARARRRAPRPSESSAISRPPAICSSRCSSSRSVSQRGVEEFFDVSVLGIAGALLAVAIVGKLVAAVGATGSPGDKRVIGFGMLPRGEVGLIFATIGLQEGVFGRDLYAALLLVVLATTLMAPPLLRWRLRQVQRDHRAEPSEPRPPGGWLTVEDGAVELAARPAEPMALVVGLEAALVIADERRPGPRLLDYLGSLGEVQLPWDERATSLLFDVLRRGDARTWRFLEVTGLLERALPELAEALRRRREDPFVIDPTSASRFALVEEIRNLMATDSARRARGRRARTSRLVAAGGAHRRDRGGGHFTGRCGPSPGEATRSGRGRGTGGGAPCRRHRAAARRRPSGRRARPGACVLARVAPRPARARSRPVPPHARPRAARTGRTGAARSAARPRARRTGAAGAHGPGGPQHRRATPGRGDASRRRRARAPGRARPESPTRRVPTSSPRRPSTSLARPRCSNQSLPGTRRVPEWVRCRSIRPRTRVTCDVGVSKWRAGTVRGCSPESPGCSRMRA